MNLNRCGECRLWMTPKCPRERHDDKAGHSRGPASLDVACEKWVAIKFVQPKTVP